MFSRIYSFLDVNKSLYNLQFGFRAKHSTIHALIQITEKIRAEIDNNNYACGIFLDLQKAFDTVDHNILIKKLSYYGIRGISNKWFQSFLSNRTQSVEINGKKSSSLPVEYGVPQGSVLGPLLFLIYINDLHTAIKHSNVYHFADDTSLLNANKSLKIINKQCNQDLKLLNEWLRANKICLNTQKTEIIIFRSKKKKILKKLNFRLSGQKIIPVTKVKYLGVIIDEHLNWNSHLDNIILKLNRATGMLAKIRHYVPYNTLINIYYAIFNSHLIYASQISGQQESIQSKLNKIQNKALKIIHFKNIRDQSNPLYNQSKILKLRDHVAIENCLFVHKQQKGLLPIIFNDHFTFINSQHNYNTRIARTNLNLPVVNTTTYGTLSITFRSIQVWNKLHEKLKTNLLNYNLNSTKKLLHNYFINQYILT